MICNNKSMKLIVITCFVALTANAATKCREDAACKHNWTKKSCCSDFECNAWCNTRCRRDSCGHTRCFKKASDFYTYYIGSGPVDNRLCYFPNDGEHSPPVEYEQEFNELETFFN